MSVEAETEGRPRLRVHVRSKVRRRGRCGRCGELVAWLDNGDGVRSWRHLDAGFATVALVAVARRVGCRTSGQTVAQVPWARHDTAFSRAFEDLVVHDAIAGNKRQAWTGTTCWRPQRAAPCSSQSAGWDPWRLRGDGRSAPLTCGFGEDNRPLGHRHPHYISTAL
jgi:zinc-finger of transposase IS204/IS1001/IS1096/IS1165